MEQKNSNSLSEAADAVTPGVFRTYLSLLSSSAVAFFQLTFRWVVPEEYTRGNPNVRGAFWLIFWNIFLSAVSLARSVGAVFTLAVAACMFLASPVTCLFLIPVARRKVTASLVKALEAADDKNV